MFTVLLPKSAKRPSSEASLLYQFSNKPAARGEAVGRRRFEVLDGPPYANGELHLGHALNKTLKHACVLLQSAMGRRAVMKANWDCHGLPVESVVTKVVSHGAQAVFACKVYALNWVKTQRLQLKMVGVASFKPQTSLSASARAAIVGEAHKLIAAGRVAFGRKHAVWNMACDSGVSDVDTARAKALTASASVAFVVVKRRLLPSQKLTTLMSTLSATASRHRLLGLKLEVDNVELMGLPLASHIRAPSRKLALASASKLRPAERVVLASSRSAINATKLNAVAVRALVVRNAFDGTDMPVVAAASASMAVGGEAWADDELGARLAPLRRALTRYRPPFSRRVVSAATNELVGEVHVANKLLTLKLLSKPNLSFKPKLVCARCGSKAMACVVTQWYIKVSAQTKLLTCNLLSSTKFLPKSGRRRLMQMIKLRPDWLISRRRRWGVPLCALRSASGVLRDKRADRRTSALIKANKPHMWGELKVLPRGYNPKRWTKCQDVLDVWFDASVAFASRRVKLPADAVIEGADQYRGWFQALALCCAVLKAKPAFKAVIAHPLVMSSKTEKMSKSKTGVWLKSTAEAGANLVRAWACSVDAVEAQAVDASWLLRPSKLWSKVSNTLRWAATAGARHLDGPLALLDKLALQRLALWEARVARACEKHDAARVSKLVEGACHEMSSAYFSLSKDQLYCDFEASALRRARAATTGVVARKLATWTIATFPNLFEAVARETALSNTVITRTPSWRYSRRLAAQRRVTTKLRKLIAKLSARGVDGAGLSAVIKVSNAQALKLFKNMEVAESLACAKAHVIAVGCNSLKPITLSLLLTREKLTVCRRCRRALYDNQF